MTEPSTWDLAEEVFALLQAQRRILKDHDRPIRERLDELRPMICEVMAKSTQIVTLIKAGRPAIPEQFLAAMWRLSKHLDDRFNAVIAEAAEVARRAGRPAA